MSRPEAREEAERRWPEKYDTTAYTGENEQRAKRAGFVAGAAWQASRAPQPTEAEWSCEQGCKAPSAVCLLDHRPAPQPTEDDDYDSELAVMLSQMLDDEPMWSCVVIAKRLHAAGFRRVPQPPDREALALAISEARSSRMTTEFDRGIADVVFDWMREQGFRRAPAEPAVQGEPTAWEYGLINPDALPGEYGPHDRAHLVSRNREHVERQHRRGHPSIQFSRRRPAGEWEPVPEGADDE